MIEPPTAQRLLTIPGVGETTAATVLAEVGEIERFDRDEELVCYAGLDLEEHQQRPILQRRLLPPHNRGVSPQ